MVPDLKVFPKIARVVIMQPVFRGTEQKQRRRTKQAWSWPGNQIHRD